MRSLRLAALVALAVGTIACGARPAPAVAGDEECSGLSEDICAALLEAATTGIDADVEGYRFRCSALTCDLQSGSLDVDILLLDGTHKLAGFSWRNGLNMETLRGVMQPVPTPPVPPTCLGVTQEQCDASWANAMSDIDPARIGDVVAVVVECTTTCTSTPGKGRTIVQFQDGTRVTVAEWEGGSAN